MLAELHNRVVLKQLSINNLDKSSILKKIRTEVDFELRNNLIYYIGDNKEHARLYIFSTIEEDIFRAAYNKRYYADVNRCYNYIVATLYILRLSRKIRNYIEHCLFCQINQIKRHRSYKKLMSISAILHFFYTIAIDFIVDLPEKHDCLLTITNKFSRRLQLIAEYSTDFAVA